MLLEEGEEEEGKVRAVVHKAGGTVFEEESEEEEG